MRKQYRYEQLTFGKYGLCIFHDGKIVENREIWGNEIFDIIEDLEKDGYTYGYFNKEIEEAKKRYEYLLENALNNKTKSFYTGKKQNLIRLKSNSEDCEVDYDKERKMYKVSIFENNHFCDEFWFEEYKGE